MNAPDDVNGDPDPVSVPRQVHCELEALRQVGTHELLSPEALDAMETYDFDAAKAWAVEDPDRYARAILAGTEDQTIGASDRTSLAGDENRDPPY